MLFRTAVMLSLTVALAGCAGTVGPASVKGECRLFRAPVTPLKGADQATENYLDDTVEAGVAGCGWKRVKAD